MRQRYACRSCDMTFRTRDAAERAAFNGCPRCGDRSVEAVQPGDYDAHLDVEQLVRLTEDGGEMAGQADWCW